MNNLNNQTKGEQLKEEFAKLKDLQDKLQEAHADNKYIEHQDGLVDTSDINEEITLCQERIQKIMWM